MAWTDLTKPTQSTSTKKSIGDGIIDNLVHLYNLLGGAGTGAGGSIQNGSFENDVDSDGIPDGWTRTLYSGGSFAIDATASNHAGKCIKFTSPGGSGNGGGYIDHDDYIACGAGSPMLWGFWHKSSVADIHDSIDILWYDKDLAYISTTTIYEDSATIPTSWTWFLRGAAAPATAVWYKIRIIGAENDDVTAGVSYWDGVEQINGIRGSLLPWNIAEVTGAEGSYTDRASTNVFIPYGAKYLLVTGQLRSSSNGWPVYCRYRISSTYGGGQTNSSVSYINVTNTLDVSAYTGTTVTVYLQCYGSGASYFYKNDTEPYEKRFI